MTKTRRPPSRSRPPRSRCRRSPPATHRRPDRGERRDGADAPVRRPHPDVRRWWRRRTTQSRTTWTALDGAMPVAGGVGLHDASSSPTRGGAAWSRSSSRSQADAGPRADDLARRRARGPRPPRAVRADGRAGRRVRGARAVSEREVAALSLLPYSSIELDVTALAAMAGDRRSIGDATSRTCSARSGRRRASRGTGGCSRSPGWRPSTRRSCREVQAAADAGRPHGRRADQRRARGAATRATSALARRLEAEILADARPAVRRPRPGRRRAATRTRPSRPRASRSSRPRSETRSPRTWTGGSRPNPSRRRAPASSGRSPPVAGRRASPARTAVAALTVDGQAVRGRHRARQRGSRRRSRRRRRVGAALEPVRGSVLVVQTWDAALDAVVARHAPTGQTLERRVDAAGRDRVRPTRSS